ncbi:unnamed protein product [Prunus brigantina]
MAPKNVDGEEKVQWPSKHEEFFIHILHDHVKKGDLQVTLVFILMLTWMMMFSFSNFEIDAQLSST